jgi:hypothetical protein
MKAILFAALVFASTSAGGTAQRTPDTGLIAGQTVNRATKADRLQPMKTGTLRSLPRAQELAAGCESLASPLSRSSLANVAGRCLS